VGSLGTPREFFDRLRAGGVQVLEYNPVNPLAARAGWRVNNRDHRKILIVDGALAFTGGINISSVYSSSSSGKPGPSGSSPFGGSARSGATDTKRGWRDTNVRLAGPAVAGLQKLFLATWRQQRGPELPERNWFPSMKPRGDQLVRIIDSGPSDGLPAIYATYIAAIRYAEKTVHLTMAYFVPDPQTLDTLKAAAARGVEVTLVLPSYTDFWAVFHAGRSHYDELLEAGVRIYERQDALLHAKTAVVDGVWSTVGSSNLDWRSFLHNAEVNAIVLGPRFGDEMEAMFRRDLEASTRITREAWAQRPLPVRMKEWAARLWAYWL
jgi:cardiolipin synthase